MPDEPTALRQKLGKYTIRREVGRGGMGVVYEGYDPIICRRVALKTLTSDHSSGPGTQSYLSRLQREAQAAGRLTHPNIVAVYDFGEEPLPEPGKDAARIAFIAMEFVEGRDLNSYLSAGERFEPAVIVRIMGQLLDALEYAHKAGVVHRDIKPANLILLPDGSLKVTDFGIARIESSTLTQAGTVMGSPSYMSPEQFLGQTVDGRSDLYSAGVVLYELLTGEVPFSGSFSNIMHKVLNDPPTPPSALNVHVAGAADSLLSRALAKRPAERFQSAAEFKEAMVPALSGSGVVAPAAHAAGQLTEQATILRKPAARIGRAAVIAAVAVCVCVAAAGLWLLRGSLWPAQRAAQSAGEPAPQGTAAADTAKTPAMAAAAGLPGSADLPTSAAPPMSTPAKSGTAVITAIGLADPRDPRLAQQATQIERQVWGDARRQLIAKAAALYIDPSSINDHYALLRDKLFSRSDEYITTVLEQNPPRLSPYGLMLGTLRATVKVHDVQRSLNEISREDRVAFIRNNGNPSIAVDVRAASDDPASAAQRSAVAENVLTDRIRAFGFVAVDEARATPPADFLLNGEVRFKHLAVHLPASGLTIEKVALTSWTIRVISAATGEEIYLNTKIPQKRSWASEEQALQEIGGLIGAEFSRDFFLQYFDFGTTRARLRFVDLPVAATAAVVSEANAAATILNATPAAPAGNAVIIDVELAGAANRAADVVQSALLNPLNHKLGRACFATTAQQDGELSIAFDRACATDELLGRLDHSPPEALLDAPSSRIEDIGTNPARLRSVTL